MSDEKKLAQYVSEGTLENIPIQVIDIAKNIVLTNLGTMAAGANAEGCRALLKQLKSWGGKKQATVLLYGNKMPAYNAALMNAFMARAVELDDAIAPATHIGASAVPTALATAELAGGCSGKEFLEALILGIELALRLNLDEHQYDGFDPTGICTIFGTTAIAGKILRLDTQKMLNALGIAFNKAGGSMQSNIDGTLSVRLIEGFSSQNGIISAQLAQSGLTGPENFLNGVYGYYHLYGKDHPSPHVSVDTLGRKYESTNIMFKKYPSCAGTFAGTDATLKLIQEHHLEPEDIAGIEVNLTPFIYKLVGKDFTIGNNPKVNAQFSLQYCVANALLRKSSRIEHFEEKAVREPRITEITKKISVFSNPGIESRGHTAMDMRVLMKNGAVYNKSIDIAPGFPGNPLTPQEHLERFYTCLSYGGNPFPEKTVAQIIDAVKHLEEVKDIRSLIDLTSKAVFYATVKQYHERSYTK